MTEPKPPLFCVALFLLLVLYAADPMLTAAATPSPIDFDRDIRPILADNCLHCHGADEAKREADLRLDSREGAIEQAEVIVPEVPEESLLIERVFTDDPEQIMPPADSKLSLTEQEKQMLLDWVSTGANWEPHWSLVPLSRPTPPTVIHANRVRNEIDSFILARLESEDLKPAGTASRERLIRRVTLDLTGLPPTLEEIDAFLADESDSAYEKVVDRLLASPRYGERMAWNWLDAARYADTNGYQGDPERTMWPWRDWIIRAMNANMPFDQFTIEQIAGDLLPNATLENRIATGFNRNNMHNGEGGRIAEESRIENVMDRVETVGAVWLGLTLSCCRCHNHKYDPLSMRDYYSLFAYFNNTSETGAGRSGQMAPTVTVTTEDEDRRMEELALGIRKAREDVATWEAKQGRADEDSKPSTTSKLPPEIQKILDLAVENRSAKQIKTLREHFEEYAKTLTALENAVAKRNRFAATLPRVMVMDELDSPRETFLLTRGIYNKQEESVTPGVPTNLSPAQKDAPPNRLGLAHWLLAKENPLTARVMMNRYWQIFFGKGLVSTPEDFGAQGARPTHPELLDWLAYEFRKSGWDVKHAHRLIVTSATYRQDSRITPELRAKDPNNLLLARGPRHRIPSWMIRDQALALSGLLTDTIGGPSVKPYQPDNVWAEATFGKKKYLQDHDDKLYRRSLYTYWRRIVGPTMFFDAAKRQTCNVKSSITNTPLHALTVLNDITFIEAARALAQRVMQDEAREPPERLASAFRRATSRYPREDELAILLDRFHAVRDQFAAEPQTATDLLACGESARDESLDPIEHATYTAICSLLLNLDETLTKE